MKIIHNKGFIALASVLVLSAIFLSLSISTASQAINSTDNTSAIYAHAKAKRVAEGCVEYALIELSRTLNYEGNGSILIAEESCEILPIGGVGNNDRVVQVQSTVQGYVYKIEVVVSQISPEMQIGSFKAITNF